MTRQVSPFALLALNTALIGCSTSSTPAPQDPVSPPTVKAEPAPVVSAKPSPYRVQAEALVAAIDSGKSDAEILKLSEELTATGLAMLPGMIESHPACKDYLGAIAEAAPTLKDLPIAEIESGYHADGKLPKMPSADCYHGKDLVVHPATVSALAKAGLSTAEVRQEAKGEIVEVLGHLMAIEPEQKP